MMFARRQKLFVDEDHNMTPKARHLHARLARDAAREAIGT